MATATYTISEPKQYVIHDRPIDKQPYRRLQTEGGDILPVNELLQIALGRVDGFENILQEYGVQFLTTLHSVSDIVDSLHIDHMQATRLLAILALGKRLYSESQESLIQIRGIEDVHASYRSMANLPKEQLRVLLMNSRYQVVYEEIVAIGNLGSAHIVPIDIFQPAAVRGINAIILVHNHPSGNCTPSQADLDFSQRVLEAGKILGIELLDHVIIGSDCFQSALPKNSQHKSVDN